MTGTDVIWIVLDSVRYDHTTMGGYRRDTTPNLQDIADADRGRSFARCISPTYATRPFTASTLTGTFPAVVDIFNNGVIPAELTPVPERFADAGYRTAGLSMNAHVGPSIGADRGFDLFRQNLPSNMLDASLLPVYLKYAANLRANANKLSLNKWHYSSAYLMTEIGKRFLKRLARGSAPFFYYAHYIEPHRPYLPPRPERDAFAAPISMSAAAASEFSLEVHENLPRINAGYCDLDRSEWEALRAMYDGEIAHADAMIGDLFAYANSIGLEDAVWIVTADHGELLGEHDFIGHKLFVDDPLVHVPMVTHGFDPAVATDGDVVQHLDVMKTLLARAGAPLEGVQGVDLDEDRRDYAISYRGTESNLDIYRRHDPAYTPDGFLPGRLFGVRNETHKYLSNGETTKLVRLPDERTDVAGERPALASEFDDALTDWRRAHDHPIVDPGERQLDAETRRQLEDLGYVE